MSEMNEPLIFNCPYCKGTWKSNYPEILQNMIRIHYAPDEFTGEPICSELQLKRR